MMMIPLLPIRIYDLDRVTSIFLINITVTNKQCQFSD